MNRNVLSPAENGIIKIYIFMEILIFFAIKWAEFTMPYSIRGKVMYSAIVLNFLVMGLFYLRNQGDYKVPLALTITLIADYFLTLTDTHFTLGVFFFFMVQIVYACKLGITLKNVMLRIFLLLFFGLLLSELGLDASVSAVCGCSIATLIGNVICAWLLAKESENNAKEEHFYAVLFAVALTLFAGCDLSLGLRIVSEGIAGMEIFHNVMNFMIWVFYSPSQVLFVLYSVYHR